MKTLQYFGLGLICLLIGQSRSFYFPDTPEGRAQKIDLGNIISLIHNVTEGTEPVTIDVPSLGTNVRMDGKKMGLNYQKRDIYAFKGIKYADAERFQIPVKIDNYADNTTINAKNVGPSCPQSDEDTFTQDEDCQYLNVYTPFLPENMTEPFAVMVFIYGGSFTSGSSSYYLPNLLLQHDVILVTINYRLGALGFFTLNTNEAPGNYALYDQKEALRWVRDHIEDFGGDPGCITVFGESAGSVSTSYMTIVAEDTTIHRAISESGTFSEVWSVDQDPEYAANYVANEVGCLDNETMEINMDCMRNVSAFDLVAASSDLVAEDRSNGLMGFRGVAPTIQPENLTDAILTQMPELYYKNHNYNDVPYMLGTNKDEGSLITSIAENSYLRKNCIGEGEEEVCLIDNEYYMRERAVTDILASFGVKDPSHGMTNTLILEYCKGVDLADYYNAAPCLIDMFGVLFLKAGGWNVANMHCMTASSDTYYYSFDYDDQKNTFVNDDNYDVGVTHAEELKYLFTPLPFLNETGELVSRRMTTLWTNFARYGDPTPDEETNWKDLDIPRFIPYYFEDHHYMLMREEFIMQTKFPFRWTIRYDEEIAGHELTMEPPFVTDEAMTTDESSTDGSSTDGSSTDGSSTDGSSTDGSSTDRSSTDSSSIKEPAKEALIGGEPDPRVGSQKAEGPAISSSFKTQEDVDDMEKKRDAYMITMIVFIVAFCVATGVAIYFFILMMKRR